MAAGRKAAKRSRPPKPATARSTRAAPTPASRPIRSRPKQARCTSTRRRETRPSTRRGGRGHRSRAPSDVPRRGARASSHDELVADADGAGRGRNEAMRGRGGAGHRRGTLSGARRPQRTCVGCRRRRNRPAGSGSRRPRTARVAVGPDAPRTGRVGAARRRASTAAAARCAGPGAAPPGNEHRDHAPARDTGSLNTQERTGFGHEEDPGLRAGTGAGRRQPRRRWSSRTSSRSA